MEPRDPRAYANLADLYRSLERDGEGEKVLRDGIARARDSADLLHALGLLHVRTKRVRASLRYLEQAAEARPRNPRYSYVFAVALDSVGEKDRAIAVLERTHRRHPGDRNVLAGLVGYLRARGDKKRAVFYLRKLRALDGR